MNKGKIILFVVLSISLLSSLAFADDFKGDYIQFDGEIKEVMENEGRLSILVEKEDKTEKIFHISEDTLVFDGKDTRENKLIHLKEGARLSVFYGRDTMETMSLPGQLTPDLIYIKNSNLIGKLDNFNEDLISSDGRLQLLGDHIDKNAKLFVLYSVSTESIPGKTSPERVYNLSPKIEPRQDNEKYRIIEGEITSLNINEKGLGSVRVKDSKGEYSFFLSEGVIVDDFRLTKENKKANLKEGAKVFVAVDKNTPILESYPPQMTPRAIIVKNQDALIKLDHFNNELVSSDGMLKLNTDLDLSNKDLIVIYTTTTKSIPGQTSPIKVIDLTDYVEPRDEVIKISLVKVNNIDLVPLRQLGEKLGYEVAWKAIDKPIDLVKGSHFTSLSLGKNSYFFGKVAAFELEQAPTLIGDKTYVPASFVSEVLQLDYEIEDSNLIIK